MAKILLIYTGGTIGMAADPVSGALRPFDFREVENEIPALRRLDVDIEYHEGFTPIDSSDVTPATWAGLAGVLRDNYDRFDGFVVLHGTDTMSYTASALGFMLENLAKPVVFTGSQIPIGVLRTDGRENLITAIEIAAARDASGLPVVPEVSIYFQNRLFRANRTTKWSAEQLNAFTSENYPPLADVGVNINFHAANIARPGGGPLKISTSLDPNVVIVRLFPGMTPQTLNAMLEIPALRGVVLQTFGAGNTPTAPWFLEALERTVARGILVVNVTQCIAGSVLPIYESGLKLAGAGIISGHDMTPEAALTKLMYVLGRNESPERARVEFLKNLRGEFTE